MSRPSGHEEPGMSVFYMSGNVIYTAEDRGGGVKGNHVDIFFDTHSQTRQHGKQTQEVFLVLG